MIQPARAGSVYCNLKYLLQVLATTGVLDYSAWYQEFIESEVDELLAVHYGHLAIHLCLNIGCTQYIVNRSIEISVIKMTYMGYS